MKLQLTAMALTALAMPITSQVKVAAAKKTDDRPPAVDAKLASYKRVPGSRAT